jgi:hypothetical protein
MPYLHWETDRGRAQTATIIKEAGIVKLSVADVVGQAQAATEQESGTNPISRTQDKIECFAKSLNTTRLAKLFSNFWPGTTVQPQQPDQRLSEVTIEHKRRAIGKVLLHAAALMEAIDIRIEKKLMFEYLHKKPPLHPRRTLDQSYYGALKDTGTRDRDQVVYRATTPTGHNCPDSIDEEDSPKEGLEGTDEEKSTKKCKQCQKDIRKVPRLIMVDQLWLWILDESMYCITILSTIIAFEGLNI